MIDRSHPALSLSAQCKLVAISRSSLYCRPKGESLQTLALMRRIDALFMKYPSLMAAVRWRAIWRARARASVAIACAD
jgi:hypothetical protein